MLDGSIYSRSHHHIGTRVLGDNAWSTVFRNARSYLHKTLYQLIRWISLSLMNYGDLYNHAKWFAGHVCTVINIPVFGMLSEISHCYLVKHATVFHWQFWESVCSPTCRRITKYPFPFNLWPQVHNSRRFIWGFPKMVAPNWPWAFLLKMIILGVFWGYHHLRKHLYGIHNCSKFSMTSLNVSHKK